MSNFVNVIKACENAGGAGTKETIKAALKTADPTAVRLIAEALNPYRVFGIRKYDRPKTYGSAPKSAGSFNIWFDLLDKLAARELTGNAAAAAVTGDLSRFDEETASYLERILDKDLKAGFSADTVNKIHKNAIPTFEVMLADKCEDQEDFEANITFPCMADFKYDGERTIAIVKKNEVIYYSRSGKEATHVNGLFDEELQKIHEYFKEDFVLDGERFASNFTETMNAKKSGNDEAKKNLRFRAFFLMPLSHWIAQKTDITMRKNRVALDVILTACKCKKIILSEGREVKDYQDMMSYCNEAIDKYGVEGLILKDWDSTYIWDRKLAWCKVKRFYDADCRVVGFYNGRPKSRLENTLGGIQVVGFLESGERVEVNVGSGFSDEMRTEIFNNQKKWLGRTVVIKYQEVSRSKSKAVASLRFPTFERDRDDKVVEI
jgi:DNA ligase 1